MLAPQLPTAVLWDMDGTLVDTEPLWFAAEAALAARHRVAWGPELSSELVGMPLEVYGAARVAQGVDLTVAQGVDELVAEVRVGLLAEIGWRPGVPELLAALAEAGVPCAMVTMSYRALAEPVVAQAPDGVFGVIVAGEDVEQGKPHPEPYLRAAAALGIEPGRCVAIEDSPPGISSAMAAGARTLGVPHLLEVEPRPGICGARSVAGTVLGVGPELGAGRVVDLLDGA